MHYLQTRAFGAFKANDPRYRVVTTVDEFRQMMAMLSTCAWIAYDTETSGLEWMKHSRICGVAFGARFAHGMQNWYVPFRHITGERQLPPELVLSGTKWLLENQQIGKICHNLKFEKHFARVDGMLILGPQRDVMIEAHLYNENENIGLKDRIAMDLGDVAAHTRDKLMQGHIDTLAKESKLNKTTFLQKYGYAACPIELTGHYAGFDTDGTWLLAEKYEREGILNVFGSTYNEEIELVDALTDMEAAGCRIDTGYLEKLRTETHGECAILQGQIFSALGYSFNLGSDDELRHVLQNRMGLEMWKRTKGSFKAERAGKPPIWSVDKEVLTVFKEHHPVAGLILEWREADKLRSTYTDSLLDRIGFDGLLHCDFQQVGTTSGRLSAKAPNLQNQPNDSDRRAVEYSGKKVEDGGIDPWSVKRAFINSGEGSVELYYDYSQIELRVLAFLSGDPTMTDVYLKGEDIHKRTGLEVFGTATGRRRDAKVINFGLSYCLSPAGFARQAKIPIADAEAFMSVFFERYPRIAPFRQEFWRQCRMDGNCFRNIFGAPRRIPGLSSSDNSERGRAERMAIGACIQGTAARLTKISIARIHKRAKREGTGLRLNRTIHDEVSGATPLASFAYNAQMMKEEMENFPMFAPIPIVVDGSYSTTNWAEKQKLPH